MYRRIDDFVNDYTWERDITLKQLRALSQESLDTCKAEGDDTSVCKLGWHMVTALPYIVNQAGLDVAMPEKPAEFTPDAIASAYSTVTDELLQKVRGWNDGDLETKDTVFGMDWPKGVTLTAVIHHEIHHRGQLSVMMRQAGLTVPSIYGPNREETAAFMAQMAGTEGTEAHVG
jgi:uncharacterized damage-inducible protein DinB